MGKLGTITKIALVGGAGLAAYYLYKSLAGVKDKVADPITALVGSITTALNEMTKAVDVQLGALKQIPEAVTSAARYFQGVSPVTGSPAIAWIGPEKQYPIFPEALPQINIETLPTYAQEAIREYQATEIWRAITHGESEGMIQGTVLGLPAVGVSGGGAR